MKKTACPEYLCIHLLISFHLQGFFPFLIICVIPQVDEVVIGLTFRAWMPNFVLRNNTRVLGN
jgi:hypothetical protein